MTIEKLDGIGLAIVGCGTIGRIRARIARDEAEGHYRFLLRKAAAETEAPG